MSAPAWSDDVLRDVHRRHEARESWASIAAGIGDDPTLARLRYSKASTGGRLARVLGERHQSVPVPVAAGSGLPARPGDAGSKRRHLSVSADALARPGVVTAGDDRPHLVGVMADERPDPDEVWRRATLEWDRTRALADRQADQQIRFTRGPACLAFVADLHLGGQGVDYPRIRRECEALAAIPNCGVVVVGDVVDAFILGWAQSIRLHTRLSVPDEWTLARTVLEILGPRLVAVVSGNHDSYPARVAGVDVLRDMVASVRRGVLYHTDDLRATVTVGGASWRLRARHKWQGRSLYNQTHGQERAARWDQDADIYVGAHLHTGGEARTFTAGGRARVAIQCGTYKAVDDFAVREGFPVTGPAAAVSLILTEDGAMIPCQYPALARRVMEAMT